MHYHCEIIIPPGHDTENAVADILEPFDEIMLGVKDDAPSLHAFWDFYVIGGRYAGRKTEAALDQVLLEKFYAWMKSEKVMVSSFQAGKQTLADQKTEEKVDAMWREMFPFAGDKCILFSHSNDQYHEALTGDVCKLGEAPDALTAERVIIAGPHYADDSKLEAKYMVEDTCWNGVTHMDTIWDGTVRSAVTSHLAHMWRATDKHKNAPTPDWVAITVDYHS